MLQDSEVSGSLIGYPCRKCYIYQGAMFCNTAEAINISSEKFLFYLLHDLFFYWYSILRSFFTYKNKL
jgi:hypothetical protein